MMNNLNKYIKIKIFFLLLSLIILMFLSYLNFSLNKNIYNDIKNSFIIKPGDSISKSLHELQLENFIESVSRIKIILYLYDVSPRFINGKYFISKEDTEYSMLIKLIKGKIVQDSIIIYEGMTHNQIIDTLKKSKLIKYKKDGKYNEKIYSTKINYLSSEGLCFPDTYKFSSGINIDTFLANCTKNMEKIVLKYWNNRDYSLPYKSPYEMLIMASIIEKETSIDFEKPIVSSVFINRLNKGMRLQADPTVIYGMKNFKGNITKKDLKENNEYNTYKINGLPRTPICSPGEISIKAASKPENTEYLYFVANDKGQHIFSKNYKDHVNAVNKYQK